MTAYEGDLKKIGAMVPTAAISYEFKCSRGRRKKEQMGFYAGPMHKYQLLSQQ